MKNKFHIAFFAIALLSAMYAPSAEAQSCEAHFPFDGSLADASGNGFDGRMIGQDGAAATPRFVEGRSGQALAFDGTAAMRAFLDLNYESCPQLSFTAWIRFEGPVRRENQVILATGGSGPGLRAVGSVLVLNGTENGVWARDAVHGDSGWMFVAGVYDYAGNTYTLHWRNRSVNGTLSKHRRLPEAAIWVGAMNRNLTHPASNIVVDDLRIFESALGAEELREIARGAPMVLRGTLSPEGLESDIPASASGPLRQPTLSAAERDRLRQQVDQSLPIDFGPDSDTARTDVTAPPAAEVFLDPLERPAMAGAVDPDLSMPDDLPGGMPPQPAAAGREQPRLEAGPAGDSGRDPGLTAPEGLPEAPDTPDTPPPGEAIYEILCEGTTGLSPRIRRVGQFPAGFIAALGRARECGLRIKVASLNSSDQWIVATSDQIAHSVNLPSALAAQLRDFESRHGGLDAADIAENGAWLIVAGDEIGHGGLTERTLSRIRNFSRGSRVISFDFHPTDNDRWVVVTDNGEVSGDGLSDGFIRALPLRSLTQRKVHQVRLTESGWLMLGTDYWFATAGMTSAAIDALRRHQEAGQRLDQFVLNQTGDRFVTYSAAGERVRSRDPVYAIEHTTGGATIWSRMREHNLVAVSIAMVRDNEIAWARGYGLRDAGEPESYVDENTTFDAASISKPIAAFGLLQLVQAGNLSLTEEGVLEDIEALFDSDDVSRYRAALDPSEGNLIQLLQHCVSVCYANWSNCTDPDGSGGGAAEYDLDRSIPTTAEMILGDNRARASHRLVRLDDSGDMSSYTSANFMLVQALLDVHGGGFLNHMEPMLRDLGMNRATYMSPYPQRNSGNFSRGWNGSSLTPMVGYGELAAASLVATPVDVARFVIAVNRLDGDTTATQPLSNALVRQFLGRDSSIYSSSDYPVCDDPSVGSQTWGLGVRAGTGWGGNNIYVHGGIHNGYRTQMIGIPGQRSGVVVFITGSERQPDGNPETTDPLKADLFFGELRDAIVAAYRL